MAYGACFPLISRVQISELHTTIEMFTVISIFFPEGGLGLVPKRGCLLTLAYYAFPRWYEFEKQRWNDILTGEDRISRRKTCPSATLSATNPTWIDPSANPGLRGERPETKGLSHGTALISNFTLAVLNWSLSKYYITFLTLPIPNSVVFQRIHESNGIIHVRWEVQESLSWDKYLVHAVHLIPTHNIHPYRN
jgi:hypothetical protein